MEKRVRITLASSLLILGLLVIVCSNSGITGAVVSSGESNTLNLIIGIFILAVSGFLFAVHFGGLEKIVTGEEFTKRAMFIEKDKKKRAIVVDTSAVLDYGADEVEKMLSLYGEVFVPDSVIRETERAERAMGEYNTPRARLLKSFRKDIGLEVSKDYRETAREYLERSEKNIYYEKIIPMMLNPEKRPKTRREAAPYKAKVKEIFRWLEEDSKEVNEENLIYALERHFKVSETDVDVLATALYEAKLGRHAVIKEKDRDFEDAVRLIKDEHHDISRNIDCVDPYERAA